MSDDFEIVGKRNKIKIKKKKKLKAKVVENKIIQTKIVHRHKYKIQSVFFLVKNDNIFVKKKRLTVSE